MTWKFLRRTNSPGCLWLSSTSHLWRNQRFGNSFRLHHQDRYEAGRLSVVGCWVTIRAGLYPRPLPYPCGASATNVLYTEQRKYSYVDTTYDPTLGSFQRWYL